MVVPSVGFDDRVDPIEVGQTHRGADLNHLAVCSRMDHTVIAGESKIANQARGMGQLVIVGCYHAAFEAVEELRGEEAEHFACAKAPYHGAAVRAAESLRGVEDDL